MLFFYATGLVHAEIWGFVDDKGVGHFASNQVDSRYELFSKSGSPQATDNKPSQSLPSANQQIQGLQTDAVLNLRSTTFLSPKLSAFFESSQTLKIVRPHMQDAAQRHNLDVELLQALIAAESGFNPTAISPKGALGLMQLMPATARRYGVHSDKQITQQQKLFDPQTNIHAGSRYLRDLLNLFKGQLDLALAAYNAGEGAVQKAGNKIPNFPETQNYVRTVTQMYEALKPSQPAPQLVLTSASKIESPKVITGPDPLRPTQGRRNGLPLGQTWNESK